MINLIIPLIIDNNLPSLYINVSNNIMVKSWQNQVDNDNRKLDYIDDTVMCFSIYTNDHYNAL